MIPLPDLLHQARSLLSQRDAILDRYESHADLVDSFSARLEEAERDLRLSLETKSDIEDTLSAMKEELGSRPDAVGVEVGEVLDLLGEVAEESEGEGEYEP